MAGWSWQMLDWSCCLFSCCDITSRAQFPFSHLFFVGATSLYTAPTARRFRGTLMALSKKCHESEMSRPRKLVLYQTLTLSPAVTLFDQWLLSSLTFVTSVNYTAELVVRSSSIVLPTLIKSTAPTPCKVIHFSRIMRTVHTHFGVPLGSAPGRWKDKKRLCCLPLYLNLEISSNLSCALISCHHLSCVTPDWP
jgi:hypothetical protein